MHATKKLGQGFLIGAFLLFGSIFPAFAFASVVSSVSYLPDDFRYGFDGSAFQSYYGGTIFQPDVTQSYDGFSFYACNFAGLTEFEYIDIYRLTAGSSSDLFVDTEGPITSIPVTVSPCPSDGSATSTFPNEVSGPSATPFELVSGEYYLFIVNGGLEFVNYYHSQQWVWGVTSPATNPPARGVEFCSPSGSFLCGTSYFNVAEGRDTFPSFDLDSHVFTPPLGECIIDTLPYFSPVDCIVNGFSAVFVPDRSFASRWDALPSLASSSPFSYLYDSQLIVEELFAGSPTTSASIYVPFMGTDVELLSQAKVASIPYSGTLLNILTAVVYLYGFSTVITMIWSKLHQV